jgi:pteridine reductase
MTEMKVPVAVITGAARRIGATIATQLHANGYHIVLHYHHSKETAELLAATLNKQRHNSVICINADLAVTHQLTTIIDSAIKRWGRVDVLVNNASGFFPTPVGNATEQQWDELFASNAKAPFFLSQIAMPFLRKTSGNIINIIDIHAEHTYANYSIYCAAKAALYSLTKNLARDLAPEVRVNGISPGPTIWPEGENALSPEKQILALQRQPLKRLAAPEDIAKTALFLLNTNSLTGEVIHVDAGRCLV